MTLLKSLGASALLIAGAQISGASAAPASCSDIVSAKVSGASMCQYVVSLDNDPTGSRGLETVNKANFFGFSDWIFDSKDKDANGVDEGPDTLGVAFSGSRKTGDYEFTGSLAGRSVMVLFKGPRKAEPNALVAYLFSGFADTVYDYRTPFTKATKKKQAQGISHISVYWRDATLPAPSAVSLPAAGLLLLAGLGGLGLAHRRRAPG